MWSSKETSELSEIIHTKVADAMQHKVHLFVDLGRNSSIYCDTRSSEQKYTRCHVIAEMMTSSYPFDFPSMCLPPLEGGDMQERATCKFFHRNKE